MVPESDYHVHPNGTITVVLSPRYDVMTEWPPAREDLGLNPAGPKPVAGITVAEEKEADRRDYYELVVLDFENIDALKRAKDRLYEEGDERAMYDDYRGAEDVKDIASALPTEYDIDG